MARIVGSIERYAVARIVVADDDVDIRELVEFKLSTLGHEIVAVGDGAAAYVWVCATNGRDGAELDDGQDRADLPECGRLRAGDERHLWTRWT